MVENLNVLKSSQSKEGFADGLFEVDGIEDGCKDVEGSSDGTLEGIYEGELVTVGDEVPVADGFVDGEVDGSNDGCDICDGDELGCSVGQLSHDVLHFSFTTSPLSAVSEQYLETRNAAWLSFCVNQMHFLFRVCPFLVCSKVKVEESKQELSSVVGAADGVPDGFVDGNGDPSPLGLMDGESVSHVLHEYGHSSATHAPFEFQLQNLLVL